MPWFCLRPHLNFGNVGTKWHLSASPMAMHIVYYKGEGGGFPPDLGRDESCEFACARGSSVHQKCFNYTLNNLLFGLCRSMWVIHLLVNLPSPHPGTLECPSTFKVLWANKRTPTHYPSVVFTFGLTIESIKELGGASWNVIPRLHFWPSPS